MVNNIWRERVFDISEKRYMLNKYNNFLILSLHSNITTKIFLFKIIARYSFIK